MQFWSLAFIYFLKLIYLYIFILIGMMGSFLQEASETCYKTIQKSWSEIDKEAAKPNGLSILTKRFKICG